MSTPSNGGGVDPTPPSGEGRTNPAEQPFDPYRFGKPDRPVPPEYAPPGYVPEQPAAAPPPGVYPGPPYGQSPAPYGQPYAPPTYGRPYPPSHSGQTGRNGKAVTALVLGIVSIATCWLSFLAVLVIVPALVFGILALNDAKSRGGDGRGMAIAGIVCAVVGAVLATVLTIFVVRAIDQCGGAANSRDPAFQQCLQDHFTIRG